MNTTAQAQARTLELADRRGLGWTSQDLEVLAGTADLAGEAVANELGRSLYAVYTARRLVAQGRPVGSNRTRRAARDQVWTPAQLARAWGEW